MLRSYPQVFNLGHPAIAELFEGPVTVQEKVDGSQFSFGVCDGELFCRSKGADLNVDEPERMFAEAVASARERVGRLVPGWTYRSEYLRTPHHNTLRYGRVPTGHLVLFDVDAGLDEYAQPGAVEALAAALDLEAVPTFYVGEVGSFDQFMPLLERESFLGGPKVEGVVVKNYGRWGKDKRPLMGKYVRPEFREQNKQAWKVANPSAGDVVQRIVETYRTEARLAKAVQHLRDAGKLESSVRDIGLLIREVPEDVLKECREEIEAALWAWAWPKIRRGLGAGLADWYKEVLARGQFEHSDAPVS